MKHLINIAICAVMMAVCTNAEAQASPKEQRMSREELAQKQAAYIARQLALDDAASQQLVTTYCDYQKEVWELGPRVSKSRNETRTDAEAEQAIRDRMNRSQKILALREKYYKKYIQFLTPKQIERVYELERKAMKRLSRHHGSTGLGSENHRRTTHSR